MKITTAISKIKKTDIDGFNTTTRKMDEKPVYLFHKKTNTISKIYMIESYLNYDVIVETLIGNKLYKCDFYNLSGMKGDLNGYLTELVKTPFEWAHCLIQVDDTKLNDVEIKVNQEFKSNKGNTIKITSIDDKRNRANIKQISKNGDIVKASLIITLFKGQIIDKSMVYIQSEDDKRQEKAFIQGFINCGLWVDIAPESDKDITVESIAPETTQQINKLCRDFISDNKNLLDGLSFSQSGHDLYLTLNGHGTGFWDRGYKNRGDLLTYKCEKIGNKNFYLGDDTKVYFL